MKTKRVLSVIKAKSKTNKFTQHFMSDQKQIFENWAETYDNFVLENHNSFPFKGYLELVDEIIKTIEPNSTILDLGIGTGYIASKLQIELNCKINGLDLSEKMVQIAKNRVKESLIVQMDFTNYQSFDWSIFQTKTNYIFGTYFFHHFTDHKKIEIIEFLFDRFGKETKILIGDIGFLNSTLLIEKKEQLKNEWDETEYYFDLSAFTKKLEIKNYYVKSKVISEYCVLIEILNQ